MGLKLKKVLTSGNKNPFPQTYNSVGYLDDDDDDDDDLLSELKSEKDIAVFGLKYPTSILSYIE